MMTSKQGWWRFPAHFLIWAAVPNIASWIMYSLGVERHYLVLVGPVAVPLFVVIVLISEATQFSDGKQTVGKMLVDLTSKVAGFVVGMATWLYYWF